MLVAIDLNGPWLKIPRQVATWVTNGIYSAVNAPGRWIVRSSLYIQDRQQLLDGNADLESQLQDLNVRVQRTEALYAENSELRQLLALTQHPSELVFIPSELSAVISVAGRNEILINRGTTHGVLDGMAVIDTTGVYGQVVEALPYTSRVILITDQRLAVPVRVQRSGVNAVVVGVGNSKDLVLEHADITADIEEGDLLVASGLAEVYPYGYPVGIVTSVEPEASGVETHVVVEPMASMHRRNWLLVVTNGKSDEVGVAITLTAALLLAMLELPRFAPEFLRGLNADLALLVCYYWATNPSARISLILPWSFGFFFDVLYAEPLGLNGLIYSIVVFAGLNIPSRSNRPILGYQLLGLLLLVIFAETTRLIAMQYVEFPVETSILSTVMSIVATLFLWFIVVFVLDRLVADDSSNVSFS